jgi:acyl dehydratase
MTVTVYSSSEVIGKRESASRPAVGIVAVRTTGRNQDGVPVIPFKRAVMVYKAGRGPRPGPRS